LGDGAGASEVDIPELVNLDLDAAKFAIKGSSLTLGTITYQGRHYRFVKSNGDTAIPDAKATQQVKPALVHALI
jgi:hypothetical protein